MAANVMAQSGLNFYFRIIKVGNRNLASRLSSDTLVFQRFFHLGECSYKPRKRSEWRKDKPPANTQLMVDGEEILETRRTFGGRSKVKAVFKNKGSYVLKSQGIELQVPILDIIHSDSNKDHVKNRIMTKGAIVQIDGTEFKTRLENMPQLLKSDEKDIETDKQDSNSDEREGKLTSSSSSGEIDKVLLQVMKSGKLFGRITTRPGQVGLCDGYILEGAELEATLQRLSIDISTVNKFE